MKKSFLLIATLAFSTVAAMAQDENTSSWTKAGYVGLKFTQASFTNWAPGGDNAFAGDAQFTYQADYKEGKNLWQNRIELGYGASHTAGDRGYENMSKTSDKIYLHSNYGRKINEKETLFLSAFLAFETQFANAFDDDDDTGGRKLVSQFMAPGYLSAGVGITWLPTKFINVIFTPATWRSTFVTDERLRGDYGVIDGKKAIDEIGANLNVSVNYDIIKNVNVYSRVNFFADYYRIEDKKSHFKNIDISWDIQLNFTINKWLSALVSTSLVYDDDTKVEKTKNGVTTPYYSKVQFKEMLALGLQYNF